MPFKLEYVEEATQKRLSLSEGEFVPLGFDELAALDGKLREPISSPLQIRGARVASTEFEHISTTEKLNIRVELQRHPQSRDAARNERQALALTPFIGQAVAAFTARWNLVGGTLGDNSDLVAFEPIARRSEPTRVSKSTPWELVRTLRNHLANITD